MPIPTQNCIQQKKSWPQYHNCFLSELHRDSPANSTAAAASYWRYGLLLPGSSLLAASTASSSKTSWFGAPGVDKKQVVWVKPTVGNQRNKGSLEGLEPRAAKVYLWDTHTAAACGDVCGLWYHILWSSHMLPVSGQPGSGHPAVPGARIFGTKILHISHMITIGLRLRSSTHPTNSKLSQSYLLEQKSQTNRGISWKSNQRLLL